jgi:hypothetical protein
MIVATTNDLPGYRVVRVIGLVRGITVRSRSIIGTIGGALQSIVGGNISLFTSLAETARQEALDLMVRHAEDHRDARLRHRRGGRRSLNGRRYVSGPRLPRSAPAKSKPEG